MEVEKGRANMYHDPTEAESQTFYKNPYDLRNIPPPPPPPPPPRHDWRVTIGITLLALTILALILCGLLITPPQ